MALAPYSFSLFMILVLLLTLLITIIILHVDRLSKSLGIADSALLCFQSFLTDRTVSVVFGPTVPPAFSGFYKGPWVHGARCWPLLLFTNLNTNPLLETVYDFSSTRIISPLVSDFWFLLKFCKILLFLYI